MNDHQGVVRKLRTTSRGKCIRTRQAIKLAIATIEQLEDENRSLWAMLDEMRKSEIENHSEKLRSEIEKVVDKTKTLLMTKTGEA
tara:strand:+ start:4536 stop:4790 length:255 start_codon:yes stop_codon:yes gene_type:complete